MKALIIHSLLFCSLLFSSIIDINSKDLHIKTPLYKIVAIGPGALRLTVYMGLEDKLIGIEKIEHKAIKFSEYRSILGARKIKSLPIIGSGGPGKLPNLEQLIALSPDVIIASFIGEKQLKLIAQKTNIPIISLSYGAGYGGSEQKLQAIKNSLSLLGKVFHKEQRAKSIIEFMNTQERELQKFQIPKKTLYVGGMGFKGAHGITSSEKHYPSFELLSITNPLTKDAPSEHIFIQEESLITQNPDFIFLDLYGKKIIQENIQKKQPLYNALGAYNQDTIFWLLAYNFYNTNVANVYINSWIILKRVGFDIDLQSKMSQIYDAFYTNGAKKLLPSRYPIEKFDATTN